MQDIEDLFDAVDSDRSGQVDMFELLNFVTYDQPELYAFVCM